MYVLHSFLHPRVAADMCRRPLSRTLLKFFSKQLFPWVMCQQLEM